MGHGFPDWRQNVDLASQELAKLTSRENFGAVQVSNTIGAVTPSAENILLSVSGEGIIYGGILGLDAAASQKTDIPRLYVDGGLIANLAWEGLNKYNANTNEAAGVYLLKYDDTAFVYSGAFTRGITFENSFAIHYVENNGNAPTVFAVLPYTLI